MFQLTPTRRFRQRLIDARVDLDDVSHVYTSAVFDEPEEA